MAFPKFQDLPLDIRLMIYERLPRRIRHHHITVIGEEKITLVIPSTVTAILQTNRAIHKEAHPVITRTIEAFILSKSPKSIVPMHPWVHVVFRILMGLASSNARSLRDIRSICDNHHVLELQSLLAEELRNQRGWNGVSLITAISPNFFDRVPTLLSFIAKSSRQLLYRRGYLATLSSTVGIPEPRFELLNVVYADVRGRSYLRLCNDISKGFYDASFVAPSEVINARQQEGVQVGIAGFVDETFQGYTISLSDNGMKIPEWARKKFSLKAERRKHGVYLMPAMTQEQLDNEWLEDPLQ